ncbi:hypothetical protein WJX84_004005 [Apatococcus fuscideae]|uniref:DUF547 domain-containing protein n=1 Tax=Apatococcus fuscideae TaxID=2026836 RepID=A0AAW1SNY8_9CHLO
MEGPAGPFRLLPLPSPKLISPGDVSDSEQTCRQQDIDDSGTVTEQGNNILHRSCTVPQVFIGGQHIGGATELQTLQRNALPNQQIMLRQMGTTFQRHQPCAIPQDSFRQQRAHVQALQGRQGHAALLRLTRDCPWTSPGHALNGHFFWHGMARPAVEVAGSLRLSILGLYERHLADDGSLVDYKGLRKDHAFADYINATAELQQVDLSAMSNPERKAFWINLYNMMVIHALTTWGPPSSFLQRLSWFGKIKYTIGGYDYSTNDVEHGMLRANGPSPVSLPVLLGQTQWAAGSLSCDDPRLAFSMEQRDPRIHFALVCGAKSCPPIKIYTAENLEEGLDAAASAFCSDDIQIDVASKEIRLSKIFKWYEMDFGTSNQMLLWLCSHLTSQKQQALQQLLKAPTDIRFSYRPYDWDINSR